MSDPVIQPTDRAAEGHRSVLSCVHRVGSALAAPAPGREQDWARAVLASLEELQDSLGEHLRFVERPGGLYPEIEEAFPEATHRVLYLRETNRSLLDRLELLMRETRRIAEGEGAAFMAVRSNALTLIGEIRHQQSRETDLVFQAFQTDIGAGD